MQLAARSGLTADRFLADAMLGRLARWLRVIGCDTAYDPTAHDPALVERARNEDRILLTRDRPLVVELRPDRALFIVADRPLEQLRQVVTDVDLGAPGELFTRCLVCNTELRPATQAEWATLVPLEARALPGPMRRCPTCGRVYWPGSHARRMRAALMRAFPEWRLA
jgi:hypothetical protein